MRQSPGPAGPWMEGMIRLVRPAVGCLLLSVPYVPLAAQTTPTASVAIERQLAAELGLSVGDTLRLATATDSLGALFSVGAVYEPSADPAEIAKRERHLRLHLP